MYYPEEIFGLITEFMIGTKEHRAASKIQKWYKSAPLTFETKNGILRNIVVTYTDEMVEGYPSFVIWKLRNLQTFPPIGDAPTKREALEWIKQNVTYEELTYTGF